MRLTTIRSDSNCDNGRTCPHISVTDRGIFVAQGYLIDEPGIPVGEIAIEMPLSLLPGLTAPQGAAVRITGSGTAVMRGRAIRDPEALAELVIPPGEGAIEVPAAALSCLGVLASAR